MNDFNGSCFLTAFISNKIIMDQARDYLDDRLWNYWELAGWNIELLEYIVNDDWEIQNQYKEWYKCWCVFYSASMNDNYCNTRDWIDERTKGKNLCDYAGKKWIRNNESWTFIINWPKTLKELNYIDWYAWVFNLSDIKKALAEKKPVHCGSNRISRSWTKKNNIAVIKNNMPWHCFHIIGYNDWKDRLINNRNVPCDVLICKDSSNNYDWWRFYIKYDDIDCLSITKTIFINNTDVLKLKKKIMDKINYDEAKAGFEIWLWNWQRPEDPITREEAIVVIFRAMQKMNKERIDFDEILTKIRVGW